MLLFLQRTTVKPSLFLTLFRQTEAFLESPLVDALHFPKLKRLTHLSQTQQLLQRVGLQLLIFVNLLLRRSAHLLFLRLLLLLVILCNTPLLRKRAMIRNGSLIYEVYFFVYFVVATHSHSQDNFIRLNLKKRLNLRHRIHPRSHSSMLSHNDELGEQQLSGPELVENTGVQEEEVFDLFTNPSDPSDNDTGKYSRALSTQFLSVTMVFLQF